MTAKYITTPIYYVNGDPHIGHVHTTVMADILKRASVMKGYTVFLSTGTDEHGQKNQEAAESSGLPTREYLDKQSQRFRTLFDSFDVSYDKWVRTTDPNHVDAVREVLRQMHSKGLIIFKEYSGLYCVGCEMFKKTIDLDDQGRCPDHLQVPVEMKESNYFLTIETFREWLIDLLNERTDWIQPEFYRGEVLSMLREPLDDLCISRPKTRVSLGIELPFDVDYVVYVWFDALINYISNLGWPGNFQVQYWNDSTHLMAKDIIKTHCIYWPIMLKALGLTVPTHIRVHGYWTGKGGQKMSKSLGNVVDPKDLLEEVGSDGVRYFLAKSTRSSDSQIHRSLVVETYNSDLVNKIGNLYSRILKFVLKHYHGTVPEVSHINEEDAELQRWVEEQARRALSELDLESMGMYVQTIVQIAERMNKYFEAATPWVLIRNTQDQERLRSLLYSSIDCLRILFELAYPIIPQTSTRALRNLGYAIPESYNDNLFKVNRVLAGSSVYADTLLFPRLEI